MIPETELFRYYSTFGAGEFHSKVCCSCAGQDGCAVWASCPAHRHLRYTTDHRGTHLSREGLTFSLSIRRGSHPVERSGGGLVHVSQFCAVLITGMAPHHGGGCGRTHDPAGGIRNRVGRSSRLVPPGSGVRRRAHVQEGRLDPWQQPITLSARSAARVSSQRATSVR